MTATGGREGLNRRDLLAGVAALAALGVEPLAGAPPAIASEVGHLLPTASHDRLLIKASLVEPRREAPLLRIGRRSILGVRSDTAGRFWRFDLSGLEPDTEYELEIHGGPWRSAPRRRPPPPLAATHVPFTHRRDRSIAPAGLHLRRRL